MKRTDVYNLIDGEREYQDTRWPKPKHNHTATEFLVYIRDYVEEALHRVSREEGEDAAGPAMRKIAALAVCSMELHGAPAR